MFKIINNEAPNYILTLIPKSQQAITTSNNQIPSYHCRTNFFKYSFFPSTLQDWFNLNASIRAQTHLRYSKVDYYPSFVQFKANNIFDPIGLKLLTRLRLGCSHLSHHNFQDCLNPLCSCSLEIEDTVHYLLHCHHFSHYLLTL